MTEHRWIVSTWRPGLAWLLVLACSGVFAACSHPDATARDDSSRTVANEGAPVKKDRMGLRRIERNPPACGADADCPAGSHCDPATEVCKWECIADSDCGPGAQCTATGACIAAALRRAAAGITANSANDTSACQQIPIAERVQALTFKQLLTSDASKIYDASGTYLGHGIKFSLRPQAVDALTCTERLSRIMPSVTTANASQEITHTRLVLAATNTFGSQVCGGRPRGTLQRARVAPSQALLVGDAVPTFLNPSAFSTIGLFPLLNTPRDTLRNMTFPSDDPSGFAGRGRYGDYILIFPDDPRACTPTLCDGWSTDALAKVDDVLLRFDVVEQDNTQL